MKRIRLNAVLCAAGEVPGRDLVCNNMLMSSLAASHQFLSLRLAVGKGWGPLSVVCYRLSSAAEPKKCFAAKMSVMHPVVEVALYGQCCLLERRVRLNCLLVVSLPDFSFLLLFVQLLICTVLLKHFLSHFSAPPPPFTPPPIPPPHPHHFFSSSPFLSLLPIPIT